MFIEGNFIDVIKGEIYPAKITFSEKVTKIQRTDKKYDKFIAPGFVDAHIRFEDSLLSPVEYTKLALLSGVTSVVEDCSGFLRASGADSIKYLISEFSKLPIDFKFLFPLNIEVNKYDSGPKEISHSDFLTILKNSSCLGLTQIDDIKKLDSNNSVFLKRISAAKVAEKPIISNIPKVHFTQLGNFAQMGIRADIGSTVYQEAFEKACFGLKIKIVEGTKKKTLSNLIRLAKQFETSIVSEEKSVNELAKGYLKLTLKKAVSLGLDPITAIQNVTINPATLLGLSSGSIKEGDFATFVELDDLKNFNISRVVFKGQNVVKNGKLVVLKKEKSRVPRFKIDFVGLDPEDLQIPSNKKSELVNVILLNDDLATSLETYKLNVLDGVIEYGVDDILKVVLASSYGDNVISIAFIKGFELDKGAVATNLGGSVGDIIAIGTTDEDIVKAINLIKDNNGGFAVVDSRKEDILATDILGTVSNLPYESLLDRKKKLLQSTKRLGCKMPECFDILGSLMDIDKSGFRITESGLLNTDSNELVDVILE